MKNIWAIFKGDVNRIRKNVIAMIVIVGITVVPSLYAWFNIAASWNPYENTGGLKVAVATVDEGYEGDLISVNLNLGEQVISALHENTQLDWIFTTKKKAVILQRMYKNRRLCTILMQKKMRLHQRLQIRERQRYRRR